MITEIRSEADVDAYEQQIQAPEAGGPPDLLKQHHNDAGNAERLIAIYGKDLKYCHAFKKWLVWDGSRWAVDDIGQAVLLAKKAMLAFLNQAVENRSEAADRFARACLDARRLGSLLTLAQCELPVRPGELDTDRFALNFKNGTVDLRTGELREHERSDFITKLVHYDYAPAAECPRWRQFLFEVMGGGPDAEQDRPERLVDYLQRALGYSMTGVTSEKAVFILFGEGDNGKSTMLTTFRQLVEEYSQLLQVDTLMVRQESNNTQADLADLRGARFVQTSETEQGQRLAQGKLKRITTGMGTIKATRKYENPIEFPETHKLWIDTNRKPTISDVDDKATLNRLHPIPFTVTIPKERLDKELPEKLMKEAEGILAWCVQGSNLWRTEGLKKPAEVEAAKDKWREDMDAFQEFVDECCVTDDGLEAGAKALYNDYKHWTVEGGDQKPMSIKAFATKLQDKGFAKKHIQSGHVYMGLRLRSQDERKPEGTEGISSKMISTRV